MSEKKPTYDDILQALANLYNGYCVSMGCSEGNDDDPALNEAYLILKQFNMTDKIRYSGEAA